MNSVSHNQSVDCAPAVLIRGDDSSWSLNLRELWQHRELLYFLTWRDIKVRYKQTVVGLAWVAVQPLAMALSLSLFLGRLVKVPSDGLPYPLFAYSGMLIWTLFSQALMGASNSLLANERLITKVHFPRMLVPASSVLASLLDFGIGLVLLVPFLIYYRITPTASLLVLPLVVFITVLIALGLGLWLSALNVKYRDVRHTVNFLVQFWFLATPIGYPTSVVPERWRVWFGVNPMTGVVEGFRWALHGSGPAPVRLLTVSTCVALLLFVSGLYYFRWTEDTFADFI
jgi:lipopolysaccharide transport system permease protein